MYRISELNDPAELASHGDAWRRLLSRSQAHDFFSTPEWITTWLTWFWRDRPIAFLFVWDSDSPVGFAPLLQGAPDRRCCAQVLALPVNAHARRTVLVCADDPEPMLDAVLSHLQATRSRIRLNLGSALATGPARRALRQAAERHGLWHVEQAEPASLAIRIDRDWPSYFATRNRKIRQKLRRTLAKLEQTQGARWFMATQCEELERAFTDVLMIERNSWKAAGGTSLDAEGSIGFYADLADKLAKRGWLRLHLLYLDGIPIAYLYGVKYGGEFFTLKTSYDAHYRALSPGALVVQRALRAVVEHDNCHLVDLLGYPSRWKRELSNEARPHVHTCLYSRSALSCRLCTWTTVHLKAQIKERTPWIVGIKRRLTAWRAARRTRGGQTAPYVSDGTHH